MDFDDLPSIFIKHDGKTCQFHTSVGHTSFILALRHQFGTDVVPDGKEVFLATETVGPDGETLAPRSFPLEDFLANKAKSQRVFSLEFSDATAVVKPPPEMAQYNPGYVLQAQQKGQEDAQRASQIRKGRVLTQKTDADGKSVTKLGKNNEMLLTHTERVELEKYVLYYWKLDPKTGVPYNQKKQPDQADVSLSLFEAKKNPILKSRPIRALRRAAQR